MRGRVDYYLLFFLFHIPLSLIRYDVLTKRMSAGGLNPDAYAWYSDLRRFGTVPHAGFGMGFERFVQFVTGVKNIRDVIPIPRHVGNCNF